MDCDGRKGAGGKGGGKETKEEREEAYCLPPLLWGDTFSGCQKGPFLQPLFSLALQLVHRWQQTEHSRVLLKQKTEWREGVRPCTYLREGFRNRRNKAMVLRL